MANPNNSIYRLRRFVRWDLLAPFVVAAERDGVVGDEAE